MYLEFLYIVFDYLFTLNKRERRFEWGIPIVLGIISAALAIQSDGNIQYNFIKEIISFLCTSLGFTLAAIALILSSNHLETRTREYPTKRTVRNKPISLYRLIVISFSYIIIMESILCLFYYIGYLFQNVALGCWAVIPNTLFIIGVFNTLFATIRMIASLFFVISAQINN